MPLWIVQRYGTRRAIPPSSALIDSAFGKGDFAKMNLITAANLVLKHKLRIKFSASYFNSLGCVAIIIIFECLGLKF
jgi:hypothetical protein